MSTKAKIAIFSVLVAVFSLAWSIPSWADHRSPGYVCNHNSCWYPYPQRGYINHNHYRGYHHRRRSDNDDAAWAIGGLILGTIIANSANENRTESRLPPPQRRVQTCYDEVAYDQDNKPYVLRRCVETVE